VHDQRIADTAVVDRVLVPLERRVPGLCPASRIVRRAVQPTDVFEVLLDRVEVVEEGVRVARLVSDPLRLTLLARAVVGGDDQNRVVEVARFFEELDEPSDLGVRVIEEPRERLQEAFAGLRAFSERSCRGSTPGFRGARSVPCGTTPLAS